MTKQETLYHENHGATLKHKCGKRIVTLSLLSFSLNFFYLGLFSFLWPLFCVRSLIPTYGGIIVSGILSSLGQCSNNDDHHTFIFLTTQQLQLDTENKIWLYMNASGGVPGYAMNQELYVWKIMQDGFATNSMATAWSCNGNMTKVMYVMMMMVEVAWQYISEWLWKCHNR